MNKVLLLVVLIAFCLNFATAGPLTVETSLGDIKGFRYPNGARAFLGIPFAKPPVGDLRWRRAKPITKNFGVLNALESGPCCPQSGLFKNLTVVESEDCLTLDIYTPKNVGKGGLPVKVYIHGGGFGSNSAALYPGDALAVNGSSVVVVINYRLSYQGFVVFSPLLKEDDGVVNFGLTDQQLALQWVQDNIEAFGGDKDNVLIFGNSAGGMSVLMHYTFPSSKNLFKVGVAESSGPWDYITAQNAAAKNDPLAGSRFGCLKANGKVNMTCLRAVPITTFYNYTWSGSQPVLDNLFTGLIPRTFSKPKAMKKAGRANTPIIIGHSKYEGNQFAWLALRIVTKNLRPALNATFPMFFGILNTSLPFTQAVTQEIATYYSSFAVNGNYYIPLREALGDYGITCGNIQTALNGVTGLNRKLYNYYFNHDTESWRLTFLNATHTVEVPYLFLTNGTIFETKFTTAERALANRLENFMTNLQNKGKPTPNNGKWKPLKKSGTVSTYTWDIEHEVIDMVIPEACTKYWFSKVVNQVIVRDTGAESIYNYDKFSNPQNDVERELQSMFF